MSHPVEPVLREMLGMPKRVVVWRIVSKDPDDIAEYAGVLVRETKQVYEVLVNGDTEPTTFPKVNGRGITLWRLA